LELRIGINIGDVFVEGGDLLGDGVNVAARLESVARPGGVCISGSTFEQVKNKLSVGFEDLGPQQVKNIPDPVAAFSIIAGPVTVAARGAAKGASGTRAAWYRAIFGLAAAVVLAGAAIGFWFLIQPAQGPKPLAAFPESLTTDSLVADDIVALMAGVTISGRRASDDQPFTIVLNPDRTANYSFGGDGAAAYNEIGRWWSEDHRFCLQVPRFARGQQACPRIVKSGETLTAVRPIDGVVLPWTLVK
jgi:hypothetical protein